MNSNSIPNMKCGTLFLMMLLGSGSVLYAAPTPPPDLTAAGIIPTIKRDSTYNLGPTGMRGWFHVSRGSAAANGYDGTMTSESRQILVTVVGADTPATGVLAVDDVILGVAWGKGLEPVPSFTGDARKSYGAAISEAEKTENAGILRLKRWRAGVTTDVTITLAVLGAYGDSAPYSCPKSALILANARKRLVSEVLANPKALGSDFGGAVNGLALLASVGPEDPDYEAVQARLQTFARTAASSSAQLQDDTWRLAYVGLFLAEYYLSTEDAAVLPDLNQFILTLTKSQSMYGTFGHHPAPVRPDGTGRRSVAGYGPVNAVGLPANLAILLGKKALIAGKQTVDPEIERAIERASGFFASYVNRGSIPYGEHAAGAENHGTNGKDALGALLFGLQEKRFMETEYFTRMTIAGCVGHEVGHGGGSGFSFLWNAMGAGMGGDLAAAAYLKPLRWHLDLERRTDGSFVFDGQEQYGGGSTKDGTYLGWSSFGGMNSTATYLLTYALPLKRLSITGKNPQPGRTLDAAKIANAITAATFKLDCPALTTGHLIAALKEFDPVVRNYASIELAKRPLTPAEIDTLIALLSGDDVNGRMGACQTLGRLKNPTAMPMLTQRLDKTVEQNPWVRWVAANALRNYGNAASSERDKMLIAFAVNATDPDVIDWSDPLQASNAQLSYGLFGDSSNGGNIISETIKAPKNLLYPALRAGLMQPDSHPRVAVVSFLRDKLALADVQAVAGELTSLIRNEVPADRMWGGQSRDYGLQTLQKYKFAESIPIAASLIKVPQGWEAWHFVYTVPAMKVLAANGDAARWTLPILRSNLEIWKKEPSTYKILLETISSIEAATTSPQGVPCLKAVADSQVIATTGAKAITLTGSSCRDSSVSFTTLTTPAHGKLTGTAPKLVYTPAKGYKGPDFFTFQAKDALTTSAPATVSFIVGTAGTGLKGEYFDGADFSNLKLTRTDANVAFDWGTGSPDPSLGTGAFSVRWSGQLQVPETGSYTFSSLTSDGVRLYINGVAVLDKFAEQETKWNDGSPIQLTAGQRVELQMEYYEKTGSGVAKLKWTGPSFAGANGVFIAKEWLYDGTGVKRTPYAHAQNVKLVQNNPQSITLSGSGGAQRYAILAQPAHGTLTGTPPYMNYTPAPNYSGEDSFTFTVKNTTGTSAPATVTISPEKP